jgi:hypothetical protein
MNKHSDIEKQSRDDVANWIQTRAENLEGIDSSRLIKAVQSHAKGRASKGKAFRILSDVQELKKLSDEGLVEIFGAFGMGTLTPDADGGFWYTE